MEEQSESVSAIHCEFYIKDEWSEPYHQHQNPVESRAIKYLSEHVHLLLDRTGSPDSTWYHAAVYLADVHNILANEQLPDSIPPLQYCTGVTQDISAYLQFTFWEPVLYLDHEQSWTSSKERSGHWLGIAHNIGDALTFWVFDDQSKHLLARSVLRPCHHNHRVTWDPTLAEPAKNSGKMGGIQHLLPLLSFSPVF